MIKKVSRFIFRSLVCLILIVIGHRLVAQDISEDVKPERKSDQYLGLQANQLLRQIFNFGNSAATITNPYLLTYAVNSKKNGFGLSTGLGYTYNQSQTSNGFTNTLSTTGDFSFRFGLESKKFFGKRWMASWGVDMVIDSDKTKTVATNTPGPGGNVPPVTTENKSTATGVGPRVTLNFLATDRIVVGTEASYYLKFITQKQTQTNTGINPPPDAKLKSFQLNLPAVLFLMWKF